jgi:peptidoglycan/LPS O-acetylase OafA/YrhL
MVEPVAGTRTDPEMGDPILRLQPTEVSPEAASSSPLLKKQMPGLDILRGGAVLSVFFFHAFRSLDDGVTFTHGTRVLQWITVGGWAGVNLFFVLSGFLITGILLDTRQRPNYWSSFYVRRVLRILPVYVVVLLLAKAYLHLHWMYVVVCVAYAAHLANYFPGIGPSYGPLWSLAVEEQFYLVWPLMVRRLTRRGLTILSCGIILVCPVLRGLAPAKFPWLGDMSTTWQAADSLAWGALVAIFLRSRQATLGRVKSVCALLAFAGIVLVGALAGSHSFSKKTVAGVALQSDAIFLFCTAFLLLALMFGGKREVLRWSAPVRFFGYISYGFYLLHVMLLFAFMDVFKFFEGPLTVVTARFLVARCAVVLVGCAALSFLSRRYFEERFLLLKERLVPYEAATGAARGSPVD